MLLPCAFIAGTMHESTGSPSTSTVQAPHSPSSQPFFVPVRPRSYLITSAREWLGVDHYRDIFTIDDTF